VVNRKLPEDAHLLYFRYAFLNHLRDEAGMAVHHEKATVFHLLVMLALSGGPFVGIVLGNAAHSWLTGIVAGLIACIVGLLITVPLPMLLWRMLGLCARKGWFLAPDRAENKQEVPVITADEFLARKQAFERDERRQFLWALIAAGPVLAAVLCAIRFDAYAERTKLPAYIHASVECALLGPVFAALCSWIRPTRRRWRKHGLLCPACGRRITDTAGLIRVPYMGLCKHCGVRVVGGVQRDPQDKNGRG